MWFTLTGVHCDTGRIAPFGGVVDSWVDGEIVQASRRQTVDYNTNGENLFLCVIILNSIKIHISSWLFPVQSNREACLCGDCEVYNFVRNWKKMQLFYISLCIGFKTC